MLWVQKMGSPVGLDIWFLLFYFLLYFYLNILVGANPIFPFFIVHVLPQFWQTATVEFIVLVLYVP